MNTQSNNNNGQVVKDNQQITMSADVMKVYTFLRKFTKMTDELATFASGEGDSKLFACWNEVNSLLFKKLSSALERDICNSIDIEQA